MLRITGNFTQILHCWMGRKGLIDQDLTTKLLLVAQQESVSVEVWQALLIQAQKLRPESPVGIEIGSEIQIQHAGVLGYLVLNSATLADGLETYQLCEKHFYGINFAQLNKSDSAWDIYWRHSLSKENHLFVQVALSSFYCFMSQRFPTSCRLISVSLSGPAPSNPKTFENFFQCPILFNAKQPGMRFDGALIHSATNGVFPGDFQTMRRQQLQAFGHVVKVSDPFLQRLQLVTLAGIPERQASLSTVAKAMNCSGRTLQRKLKNYGLSFQQLIDGVREQLAIRYLARTSLSLSEIPFLLGYSDQSAFSRAFKQWSGSTPLRYRIEHRL